MRLLSALEQNAPRRRASGASSAMKGLIALATLSIAGVAALVVATNSDGSGTTDVVAMGSAPPSASTTLLPSAGTASAPMESIPMPAAAASAQPEVGPREPLASSQPEGIARVERTHEGLAALPGMAAAAGAVASERAAASMPATAPASATAGAPPHPKARPAATRKPPATTSTRVRSEVAAAEATARDPDAELVAAIMARLESPRSSNTRAPNSAGNDRAGTIASLVRDCNAMADSTSALACRRRICDGYWGKAQACPKSMAPAATSGGTASAL
jgi:hypothetical protein